MSIEINAESRTDQGKGASRRLRHAEKLPAILYGAGKDPVTLTLEQKDLRPYIDDEQFYTSILDLKVDGAKAEKVIVRDMQHHPYKVDLMHIDFQRISAKEKMHIHVPLHFIGEDIAPGVKTQGGLVSHMAVEVEVECLPKDIPDFIEVDMSAMNTGDILHMSDLVMPKGVELMALKQGEGHDTAIASIHAPKVSAAVDDTEAGEAEEAAGEE
ncbi:MAG: 50S ribosomal protein L25/general stress protein Ctc [Gammaproteobacteria bacterium]|nr:50S ribosomal protein L25/general stress protein Ctc [Gammaproteobacteria bacterium]